MKETVYTEQGEPRITIEYSHFSTALVTKREYAPQERIEANCRLMIRISQAAHIHELTRP